MVVVKSKAQLSPLGHLPTITGRCQWKRVSHTPYARQSRRQYSSTSFLFSGAFSQGAKRLGRFILVFDAICSVRLLLANR